MLLQCSNTEDDRTVDILKSQTSIAQISAATIEATSGDNLTGRNNLQRSGPDLRFKIKLTNKQTNKQTNII